MQDFDVLYKLTQEFKTYLISNRVNLDKELRIFGDKITKATIKWCKQINEMNRETFISQNKVKLFSIHDTLCGSLKGLYFKDDKHTMLLRSCHDKIFRTCLNIKQPARRFATLANELATSFCHGITYFGATSETPFYHREESCGDKAKTASEKFALAPSQQMARLCYIERVIYDKIYTNTFYKQDVRHMYELESMARIYDSYFPGENIQINISFKDDIQPIKLTILYYEKSNIIIEEYTHVSQQIHCIKHAYGAQYTKVQTSSQEQPWHTTNT
jgi:hypothetical protein